MIIQRFWGVFWLRANIKHLFQCSKQTPAEHFKSNSEFSSFVSQRPRKRWTGYFFPFVQKLCLESESESPTKDLLLEKISWTLYCVVCFGLEFSALFRNTIVLVFMAKPPLARQYGHESNCHNIVLKPHFWCCYDKNERSYCGYWFFCQNQGFYIDPQYDLTYISCFPSFQNKTWAFQWFFLYFI